MWSRPVAWTTRCASRLNQLHTDPSSHQYDSKRILPGTQALEAFARDGTVELAQLRTQDCGRAETAFPVIHIDPGLEDDGDYGGDWPAPTEIWNVPSTTSVKVRCSRRMKRF